MKKSEALNTLGLAQGASEEDIKKAHRKLIIENHPAEPVLESDCGGIFFARARHGGRKNETH